MGKHVVSSFRRKGSWLKSVCKRALKINPVKKALKWWFDEEPYRFTRKPSTNAQQNDYSKFRPASRRNGLVRRVSRHDSDKAKAVSLKSVPNSRRKVRAQPYEPSKPLFGPSSVPQAGFINQPTRSREAFPKRTSQRLCTPATYCTHDSGYQSQETIRYSRDCSHASNYQNSIRNTQHTQSSMNLVAASSSHLNTPASSMSRRHANEMQNWTEQADLTQRVTEPSITWSPPPEAESEKTSSASDAPSDQHMGRGKSLWRVVSVGGRASVRLRNAASIKRIKEKMQGNGARINRYEEPN
ncbi:hypothetical protein ACN47E_008512 [Coniothyrium glycines]